MENMDLLSQAFINLINKLAVTQRHPGSSFSMCPYKD